MYVRLPFSWPVAVVLLLATAGPATAVTHYVKASATGTADGTSWVNAFITLQDALAAAAPSDDIWVAQGVYYPDEGGGEVDGDQAASFKIVDEVSVRGGFGGFEAFLSQRRPSFHLTVLSGDIGQDDNDPDGDGVIVAPVDIVGGNSRHVVRSSTATATTTLEGFTITAGSASDFGGGLLLDGASLTVRQCRFLGNTAGTNGGGIYLSDSSSTVANCLVAGNSATSEGGGIHAAHTSNVPTPTFYNCAVRGNAAAFGGGLRVIGGTPSLINCSFSGNSGTTSGGAIRSSAAIIQITNTVIWNNLSGGSSATLQASIEFSGPSSTTYNQSLIHNYSAVVLNGSGSGNLNGTTPANAPLFVDPPDPGLAPTVAGDLRLEAGSPVLEKGDSAPNPESRDLGDRLRVTDGDHGGTAEIDLGAHELGRLWFVDDTAGGTPTGLTWADAFLTLQDALAVGVPGDEVRVAEGVYWPDLSDAGVNDSNDPEATFQLLDDVALVGGYSNGGVSHDPAVFLAILSGDIGQDDADGDSNSIAETTGDLVGTNSYSVVTGSGVNPGSVDGFFITAGKADQPSVHTYAAGRSGGGVYCNNGSPSLWRCTVIGNLSVSHGGGVFCGGIANVPFGDCTFSGNDAIRGGAISAVSNESSASLRNCLLTGNTASEGGAIRLDGPSSLSAISCEFSANSGGLTGGGGGGAVDYSSSDNNIVYLDGCQFLGNTAVGGGAIDHRSPHSYIVDCEFTGNVGSDETGTFGSGGAINATTSLPTLVDCLFTDNSVQGQGGAIRSGFGADATMTGCTFQGNSAGTSGGVLHITGSAATLSMVNCNFTDNSSVTEAGAFYLSNTALTLQGCTFSGNSSEGSGGIMRINGGSVAATGCDFSGGQADGSGGAIYTGGGTDFLQLTACLFDGNSAVGNGGAIYHNGIHPTTIMGCTFDGNSAANGGALELLGGALPSISDSAFLNNTAALGGAIRNSTIDPYTVSDCVFEENMATSNGGAIYSLTAAQDYVDCEFGGNSAAGFGGGVYLQNSTGGSFTDCTFTGNESGNTGAGLHAANNSSPVLTGCSFVNNNSVTSGGAVANSGASSVFRNCNFSGNSAQGGGAILNTLSASASYISCTIVGNTASSQGGGVYTAGSVSTFTNCVIAGNSANNSGGGIYNQTSSSSTWKFSLVNCTVSGNSAGFNGGGGIHTNASGAFAAVSELTNTVLWNNRSNGSTSSPEASIKFMDTAEIDYVHSLVEHFDLSGVGTANLDGTDYAGAPHFVVPFDTAAAPSTVGDLRLTVGTPAVDSGDNAANIESTDVAGNPRIVDGTIDLGAYEGGEPLTDADGDCLPDNWEIAAGSPPSSTAIDPASDVDDDGLDALQEFAFGLDPNVANGAIDYIFPGAMEIMPDEFLTVTYKSNPAAAGFVNYVVSRSTDLGVTDPWDDFETTFVSIAGLWVTRRSNFPRTATQPKEFLRMKVK